MTLMQQVKVSCHLTCCDRCSTSPCHFRCHTRTHTHARTRTRTRTRARTHVHAQTCAQTCAQTWTRKHVHANTRTHTHPTLLLVFGGKTNYSCVALCEKYRSLGCLTCSTFFSET